MLSCFPGIRSSHYPFLNQIKQWTYKSLSPVRIPQHRNLLHALGKGWLGTWLRANAAELGAWDSMERQL